MEGNSGSCTSEECGDSENSDIGENSTADENSGGKLPERNEGNSAENVGATPNAASADG
jgi:hypothetical protein